MSLRIEIVTPKGAALQAQADEIVVPGILGELGILSGHLPLLSGLKPGVLRLRRGGQSECVAVGAGFVQVGAHDHVIVLTEICEKPDEVDVEDARGDLAQAEEKLRTWQKDVGAEFERLEMTRAWAEARLRVAETKRT